MARVKDKIRTPKVILVKKEDDLEVIINYLKNKEEVIVNVSLISLSYSYRIIDFLSGYVMGLNGTRKKIEDKIYSFKLL